MSYILGVLFGFLLVLFFVTGYVLGFKHGVEETVRRLKPWL